MGIMLADSGIHIHVDLCHIDEREFSVQTDLFVRKRGEGEGEGRSNASETLHDVGVVPEGGVGTTRGRGGGEEGGGREGHDGAGL